MTKARSNAVAEAAKGDLSVGTGTNLAGILAVGSNGDTLVADSSATTGLRWTQTPSASNPVLNSAMQIWQRGTSIAGTTTSFSADRWQSYRGVAGSTFSRQSTNDTTNLPFIQNCARVQRDAGNTSTTPIAFAQNFESVNSIPYAGKTVTLSLYARAGANFSQASNALPITLFSGTGTDQNTLTGYAGQTSVIAGTATLTTTWQRFTFTGTFAANITEMAIYIGNYTPVGTAGAADYYEITGVQLDYGLVALPFRTNAGTIQGELAACQRYYYRLTADQSYSHFSIPGTADGTTSLHASVAVPVSMRINPTSVDFSTLCTLIGGTVNGFSSLAISTNQSTRFLPCVQVITTGLTANAAYSIAANNSFNAYLGLSAEL